MKVFWVVGWTLIRLPLLYVLHVSGNIRYIVYQVVALLDFNFAWRRQRRLLEESDVQEVFTTRSYDSNGLVDD